ncbi:tetratricopeptide repeat protein [Streptomyces sp. NPDC050625]|uniref:tetratricopeptide repeat protein n=1 Tax=Streptomyces sp. NPDC050625 TaxID=3154629 RepID=UPI003414D213
MTGALDQAVAQAERQVLAAASGKNEPPLTQAQLSQASGSASPEAVDRVCYLAALLARLGRHEDAVRLLRTVASALATYTNSAPHSTSTALNHLAVSLTSIGAWEPARTLLQAVVEQAPESQPLLRARACANLAAVEIRAAHLAEAHSAVVQARGLLVGQDSAATRDIVALLDSVDLALARAGAGAASVGEAEAAVRAVDPPDDDSAASLAALTGRAVLAFEEALRDPDPRRLRELTNVLNIVVCRAAAALGAAHPQTVVARVNLVCAEFESARRAGDQRRMAVCVERMRTTAVEAANVLGASHPVAVTALTNQAHAGLESARAQRSEEQLAEAARQLDRAAERSQAALGASHPLTVLATGTARAGRRLSAAASGPSEPEGRGGVMTLTRTTVAVADPWHPGEALMSPRSATLALAPDRALQELRERRQLASRIGAGGNASAALELFVRLEADCQDQLSDDSPFTLGVRHGVAYWTGVCGRAPHARQLSLRLMDVYASLYTDQDRVMRVLRDDLARWTGESGEPGDAVRQYRELRHDTEQLLGADHPETLVSRHNTAYWIAVRGDRLAALHHFQMLLADVLRINGPHHRHTLAVRHNIAYWTDAKGDPHEALRLFTDLLQDRTRVLGGEHPHSLLNAFHVARLTRHHRDASAGAAELARLLPVFVRVFSEDHPWTRRLHLELAQTSE